MREKRTVFKWWHKYIVGVPACVAAVLIYGWWPKERFVTLNEKGTYTGTVIYRGVGITPDYEWCGIWTKLEYRGYYPSGRLFSRCKVKSGRLFGLGILLNEAEDTIIDVKYWIDGVEQPRVEWESYLRTHPREAKEIKTDWEAFLRKHPRVKSANVVVE